MVHVTGDDFAPNFGASLAFTSGTDTGTATVNAAGHLTGTITVNTANEALGSNDVIVTQATSGLTATAALNISAIDDAAPDHQRAGSSRAPAWATRRAARRSPWVTPS